MPLQSVANWIINVSAHSVWHAPRSPIRKRKTAQKTKMEKIAKNHKTAIHFVQNRKSKKALNDKALVVLRISLKLVLSLAFHSLLGSRNDPNIGC